MANVAYLDIMKSETPKVEIMSHLNRAYVFFDFESSGTIFNGIVWIQVHIIEYGSTPEGKLNPNDVKNQIVDQVRPSDILNANNSNAVPLHHAVYDMQNSWYEFKFIYCSQHSSSNEGSMMFYSKQSNNVINNLYPSIFSGYISRYITGSVSTHLRQKGTIELYYEVEPNIEKNVIVKKSSPGFQVINKVYSNTEYTTSSIDTPFLEFLLALFNDDLFFNTFFKYYKVDEVADLPIDNTVPFRFIYNQDEYLFIISGNIQNFVENYKGN